MIFLEASNFPYNRDTQVAYCFAGRFLMNENQVKAQPCLMLGFNGKEFVLSSDWLVSSAQSGEKLGIVPYTIAPQYIGFTPVYAGVKYQSGRFGTTATEDPLGKESNVQLLIGSKTYTFATGELVIVPIQEGEEFITCDCEVKCIEQDGVRIYKTLLQDGTSFGVFRDGMISPKL